MPASRTGDGLRCGDALEPGQTRRICRLESREVGVRSVIVGAHGGIGEATARRLAAAGHELVLTARSATSIEALAAETGACVVELDVETGNDWDRLTEAAESQLDGLVYAAGTITLKPIGRLSDDDFLRDFRINALGAAKAVQSCLPALTASDAGSIVLFSTVAVDQGFAAHSSIAMAKGAVVGLMRSLAAELAPGIRVNAIAPSLIDSPLGRSVAPNEKIAEAVAKLHPVPRLGQPDEIAAMVAFLLSPEAGWITGQTIGIDGGRSTLRTGRS
ncbi:SDR family NAD(P)-dependent oxidoreductase [Aureimonas pseudogalii]|uniref:NAD(P)-dependent dehydrogenase (Short-subunit alcohol dehydrogenase family) n=1 Tax=Aureimonas pseudogalii TaxID=1744844 RepID=A0A7W6H5Z9_9HYPH|nr:SDR family oxidoreductase [Aureimonas pseudogalii]MBB3999202.1 NAD(P)-dependent dehydrogenase (short-subunit alcohol dehydrogenase family) [Aureimonas pseudogalii]